MPKLYPTLDDLDEPQQPQPRARTQQAPSGSERNMADLAGMAFVPYYRHLMELLETNEELKKTVKGIMKQMAWGAGGACVGGIVGGPVGAMVGGIAGSVVGYLKTDEYTAMVTVLKNLTGDEQRRLVEKVQTLVGSTGLEALTAFIGTQVQREMLVNLVREFAGKVKGG